VPLPAGDDLEAAGARPINDLAGQRRLVAIGERIDGALGSRLSGQERTGEHVGLYIDHDNVLAGSDRCAGMGDPGGRATGRLDNDLDLRIGARFGSRPDKTGSRDPRRFPPHCPTGVARPLGIEIGDDRNL